MSNPENRRRGRDPWPLALTALGLALRLASARAVFRGGSVYFIDPDDYYHLRRMMTAAANFPRLPSFDPYLGFPSGFHCNWPPLYDWLVGLLTLVAGLGHPSLRLSEIVAGFVPPMLGALTLWVFYRASLQVLPRRAALWALAVAAVLPMNVFYTALGRPDHHCAENLGFAAALWAAFNLFKGGEDEDQFRGAAALAVVLACATLCWIGSVIFPAALFMVTWPELTARVPRGMPPRSYFWLGAAFLIGACLLAPFCLLSHWGLAGLGDFDAPSVFQPMAFSALGLTILGSYGLRQKGRRGLAVWRDWTMEIAGTVVGFFLVNRALQSFALFTGAPLPVFSAASEMQPFFRPYGDWSLANAGAYFGYSLWVLPVLAWLFSSGTDTSGKRLVTAWTVVTAAAMVAQTRYAYHLCLPAAMLLGFGADRLMGFLESRDQTRPFAGCAALAAAILILFPALRDSAGLVFAPVDQITIDRDLIETCDWLRNNTPPTRSLWREEGAPEYGVYALHDNGGPIAAIAQRPAAAGNMHVMRAQILDSVAFFLMDSAGQAYDFLRARRFRYVVLNDIVHDGILPMEAEGLGVHGIGARLWDLVYMRLYVNDGSLSRHLAKAVAPVGHFRLVHESSMESFGVKRFKVFEVVAGAAVSGRCAAGVIEASIAVRTDQGRPFTYQTFSPCEDGHYALNLPYAGRYDLVGGKRRGGVDVSESDVVSGSSQSLSF